jgi:ABC-2 type transport system ATP-binding protein
VALDDVTLHVRPGDRYGFAGHNGAGKTTALRIALGLIRADAGAVLGDGFDASRHAREARARQGGLIETPAFYPWLSGRRNLTLLGVAHGLSRRESGAAADRLLETVGLASDGHRRVGGYSQGMRQRLGIARSLFGDPPLLLLDEPTNGLDPEGIEEVRGLLVHLTGERGKTVLLSSHQLVEVAGLCNRIGILKKGRLLVEAETADLLADERHRYRVRTNDDEAARAVLAEHGLEPEPAADGGLVFEAGEVTPGRIAKDLVGRGLSLDELAAKPVTLEEIYLRYSRDEEGEAARAESPPAPAPPAERPADRRAPRLPVLRTVAFEAGRLFRAGPIFALLLPACLAAFSVFRLWGRSAGHLGEVEEGALFSSTLVTAFEGVAVALGAALPLAAVVVAGMASQALAGELSRGTLRNLLLAPLGRVPLALGKALGAVIVALFCYILLAGTALGASALAFDYTDVVEIMEIRSAEPWVVTEAKALWPVLWRMLPAMAAPLAAYAGLGYLAGALTRRSASALALAVGGVVFIDLARVLGRELGFERGLLSAYLPSPLGDTSWVAHMLDLIRSPNEPPGGYLDTAVWVPLAWLVACVVISTFLMKRRPVP